MLVTHLFVLSIVILFPCVSYARQQIKIRLRNGKHRYEGRIELFREGKWGDVCDDKWDLNAARVACRMLGFPDAERFTFGDWWGRGSGRIWLDDVVCHGDEYSLEECAHKDWGVHDCSDDRVAGVICRDYDVNRVIQPKPRNESKKIVDLPVRLLGKPNNFIVSKGVLQVKVNDQWGFVCSEMWTQDDSKVACGMLGFPRALNRKMKRIKTKQDKDGVFLMSNVSCYGLESSLVQCKHLGWGPLKCHGGFPVNLVCDEQRQDTEGSKIRLRGSYQLWEGRLEVKSNNPLHWGTVCDDQFDLKDANVACRTLGLGTASRVFTNARFGQGIGSIYMDNVNCRGWEKSFHQCSHRKNSDCSHYEDVSVRCNSPELYTNKIRLFGGNNKQEGYVEIWDERGWGAVCAEDWGLEEAIVTCRQLNLGYAREATRGNYFRPSRSKIRYSNVECKIYDPSLSHCARNKSRNIKCENNLRAGVICVTAVPDLVVDVEALQSSLAIDVAWLRHLRCAYEEKCLSESAAPAWASGSFSHRRRLLRFTTRIENRGLAPFRPNVPQSAWQWHSCHNHYHSMETFSTYQLLTVYGSREQAAGHKASFCLEDTVCDKGVHKTFNCTNRRPQGISPNCYDVYKWNIDCQWIDVTDFPHGYFILRVTVNPDRKVPESDYANNIAKCWIYDYGNVAYASNCHLESCESSYKTHGGNSNGACCVFPFKHNNKWHYKCLPNYWGELWCGTTSDFDKDKKWGLCR